MRSNITFEKPKITLPTQLRFADLGRAEHNVFVISIEELEKEGPKVQGLIKGAQILSLIRPGLFFPGCKNYLFIGKGVVPPILGSRPVFSPPLQ